MLEQKSREMLRDAQSLTPVQFAEKWKGYSFQVGQEFSQGAVLVGVNRAGTKVIWHVTDGAYNGRSYRADRFLIPGFNPADKEFVRDEPATSYNLRILAAPVVADADSTVITLVRDRGRNTPKWVVEGTRMSCKDVARDGLLKAVGRFPKLDLARLGSLMSKVNRALLADDSNQVTLVLSPKKHKATVGGTVVTA